MIQRHNTGLHPTRYVGPYLLRIDSGHDVVEKTAVNIGQSSVDPIMSNG